MIDLREKYRATIYVENLLSIILFLLLAIGCFAFHHPVIRVVSFLMAVIAAFLAFSFFERVKLGNSFLKSHTGKSGYPGSVRACVAYGTVLSTIALFFVYCALRH